MALPQDDEKLRILEARASPIPGARDRPYPGGGDLEDPQPAGLGGVGGAPGAKHLDALHPQVEAAGLGVCHGGWLRRNRGSR